MSEETQKYPAKTVEAWWKIIDKMNTLQVVNVTFTKKNGEVRVMRCTRSVDFIPPALMPKSEPATNYEVVNCLDVEKQAWRSFRVDSVISIEA